jgi:hypothetical protein
VVERTLARAAVCEKNSLVRTCPPRTSLATMAMREVSAPVGPQSGSSIALRVDRIPTKLTDGETIKDERPLTGLGVLVEVRCSAI